MAEQRSAVTESLLLGYAALIQPAFWGFTRELYQWRGVAGTVNMRHIKEHYCRSHPTVNPNGIVPSGPILGLEQPHDRALLTS